MVLSDWVNGPFKITSYLCRLVLSGKNYDLSISQSANEMFFFIDEFERSAKVRKIAIYRFLISLLVPEL